MSHWSGAVNRTVLHRCESPNTGLQKGLLSFSLASTKNCMPLETCTFVPIKKFNFEFLEKTSKGKTPD